MPGKKWSRQWVLPLALSTAIAVGGLTLFLFDGGKQSGARAAEVVQLRKDVDSHRSDGDIHLSIGASVALEKRLGTLEGTMDKLTDALVRVEAKLP